MKIKRSIGVFAFVIAFLIVLSGLIFVTIRERKTKEENARLEIQNEQLRDQLISTNGYEILPCPFCGSTNVTMKDDFQPYIMCKDCHAMGPTEKLNKNETLTQLDKEEVIEAWNKANR